ncbi:MAG: RNA polymerase subunit sigma-70 [Calditrichaeota bacterium]|nr:MAG: RNA polymerase subunit sigma-70 [Calditrichota bacterium]
MNQSSGDVTQILNEISSGNKEFVDQLIPIVYDELRKIAGNQMYNERGGHTLSPTSLVHEAYMKLVNQHKANWQNRAHFFALASISMRRILINYANQRVAQKRGGDLPVVTFNEELMSQDSNAEELIMLDRALDKLKELSERQAKVIEYKFFGGLSFDEIAEVLKVSLPSIRRDWRLARAWLLKELKE